MWPIPSTLRIVPLFGFTRTSCQKSNACRERCQIAFSRSRRYGDLLSPCGVQCGQPQVCEYTCSPASRNKLGVMSAFLSTPTWIPLTLTICHTMMRAAMLSNVRTYGILRTGGDSIPKHHVADYICTPPMMVLGYAKSNFISQQQYGLYGEMTAYRQISFFLSWFCVIFLCQMPRYDV